MSQDNILESYKANSAATLQKLISEGVFKYKALFDSNMLGIASTDFEDAILSANDAFLSIIGYTQKDLEEGSLRWSVISPSKYDEADLEKIDELIRNGSIIPFEKEYLHKDGHPVAVLVGAEYLGNEEGKSFGVCFAVDISKMKELEQKKDDFVGIVAHELKTPLSIMKLYADFLEDAVHNGAPQDEILESVNEISNQVDKLSMLISDLHNMSRYQAAENVFQVSTINLRDCVRETVTKLSLINDRKILFHGEKPVFVHGNQERLCQVVTNLINNANRYSSRNTDIIVHVFKKDAQAYVQVQDFGMGIGPENLEKIFERYYRINHADDYAEKAAGIGLYICREILKHHNGQLLVESELGGGSTFTIKLPAH